MEALELLLSVLVLLPQEAKEAALIAAIIAIATKRLRLFLTIDPLLLFMPIKGKIMPAHASVSCLHAETGVHS